MTGEKKENRRQAKEAVANPEPIQEYRFFVTRGEEEGEVETAERPAEEKKKKGRNKKNLLFSSD
jgi:hypothetical protein